MTLKLQLLLVEDSEDDAVLLEHELRRAGYELRVHRVWTPESLKAALDSSWDLVISDWHMPLRAFELVRQRDPDLPFIIVSAKSKMTSKSKLPRSRDPDGTRGQDSQHDAIRILLVDDDARACEALAVLLRLHGYDVVMAHDGRSGLAKLAEFLPDVAIFDLGMPELDGWELASRVRADARFRSLPLIALSGYTEPEHVARSRAVGFDHHLAKPPDWDELRAVLTSVLSRVT